MSVYEVRLRRSEALRRWVWAVRIGPAAAERMRQVAVGTSLTRGGALRKARRAVRWHYYATGATERRAWEPLSGVFASAHSAGPR